MTRFHDGLGHMRVEHEKFGRAVLLTWTLWRALIVSAALSLLLAGCGHQPTTAVRESEADALRALAARVDGLAGEDEFSGAVLVAKHGRVLFSNAYGLADRNKHHPQQRQCMGPRYRAPACLL